MFEHAPYRFDALLCTSGGICGKVVSPPCRQSMVKPQVRHPEWHVCAVNVCKPASSTSSTGRVTDQPYPAGDTGGQRHIPLPYSEENLVGIKFGDFSQNIIFINQASFKFGDSGPQPLNVTSPLWWKQSLWWLIESPVVCDFKLREDLAWPGRYRWGTSHSCPL